MTKRPTDDDQDDIFAHDNGQNNADDSDAEFGDGQARGKRNNRTQNDDDDFIADDMSDIADELAADEDQYADDLLAEDGDVQYEIVEDEQPAYGKTKDAKATKKTGAGKQKKSDLIFYAVLGLGALIAIIIALTSVFGGGDKSSSTPLLTEQNSGGTAPAEPTAAPAAESPTTDLGIAGGISTLKPEPETPVVPPASEVPPLMPTPTAETPAVVPATPTIPEATAPAPVAIPSAPEPIVQADPVAPVMVTAPPQLGVDNTALAERMAELSQKLAELNAHVIQTNESISGLQTTTTRLEKQNQDLAAKNAELSEKIEQQNGKISQVSEDLSARMRDVSSRTASLASAAATATPPPVRDNSGMLDEMKISIAALERKIATLGKATTQPAPTPVRTKAAPEDFSKPVEVLPKPKKTEPKPAPVQEKVIVASKPQTVARPTPAPAPQVAAPRSPKERDQAGMFSGAATTRNQWVLRAATPTTAWLSPRPGSAELKRVSPGDTVEGIGQVLEIIQQSGRWVVIGSEGSIK